MYMGRVIHEVPEYDSYLPPQIFIMKDVSERQQDAHSLSGSEGHHETLMSIVLQHRIKILTVLNLVGLASSLVWPYWELWSISGARRLA